MARFREKATDVARRQLLRWELPSWRRRGRGAIASRVECLTDNQLGEFLRGEISTARMEAVEAHIDQCPACRQLLSALSGPDELQPRSPIHRQLDSLGISPQGEVLDRFELERVLGVGGMGVVVAATHRALAQRFAIKFLSAERAGDPAARARFLHEARAAARLRSPHACRVHDVVEAGAAPFIVMEYLEGEDLQQHVARNGQLSVGTACGYLLQALQAIAEAHSNGVVHRDLKPANLFLTVDGQGRALVKVVDFGIAHSNNPRSTASVSLTSESTLVGSPHFMAPEQLEPGQPVDAKTDIWALGCTLYELVVGRPPFSGEHLAQLVASIQRGTFEPASRAAPNVPSKLDAIIGRCLQQHPAHRFPDVGALAAALERLMSDAPAPGASRRWIGVTAGAAAGAVAVAAMMVVFGLQQARTSAMPASAVDRSLVGPATPVSVPGSAMLIAPPPAAPTATVASTTHSPAALLPVAPPPAAPSASAPAAAVSPTGGPSAPRAVRKPKPTGASAAPGAVNDLFEARE